MALVSFSFITPQMIIACCELHRNFSILIKMHHDRISALLLATIGVVLATLIGGFLLVYVAGLPFLVAFAFAALISPTDAALSYVAL
jgi:NhaP-type Na+/H+ and K+/H+ antiporter